VPGHADTPGHPTCRRCGSSKLRRSHSRSRLQKLLRQTTLWDRYACGSCGHRGWSWGKVPARQEPLPSPVGTASGLPAPRGRKVERRDHRLRRRLRARAVVTLILSLALGVVVALYLQRCGAAPTPVE
jgi:hypothetical protein